MLGNRSVISVLLGEETRRSGLIVVLSLSLFVFLAILARLAEAARWDEWVGHLFVVVLLVVLVGGGVAAANAYWNNGLIPSWLLVFGPVYGWLWGYSIHLSFWWAVLALLFVGTPGYVIGRGLGGFPERAGGAEPSGWLLVLLVGDDFDRVLRWGALASGLLILAALAEYAIYPDPDGVLPIVGFKLNDIYPLVFGFPVSVAEAIVVLGWIAAASWPAVRNDGFLISWGLPFAPLLGSSVSEYVLYTHSNGGLLLDVTMGFLMALIISLVIGIIGFVLGTVIRSIRDGVADSFVNRNLNP